MRKNLKYIVYIVVVLLCVFFIAAGYKFYNRNRAPINTVAAAKEIVSVQPLRAENIVITKTYIGQVEAINQTEIVPYISGYVSAIKAHGGQDVRKDDILVILHQEEYSAALAAAAADLFAVKAEYFNAKNNYRRMLDAGDKAVSATELDNAKAAYLSAQGRLEQATANHFAAQTNFNYTYLKAPFDGTLGNIALSIGEYISPQSHGLLTLVQYNPIRIVFSVSDKEFLDNLTLFTNGQAHIKIKLANGKTLPYGGTIKYTSNTIDLQTNSVALYAEIANPEHLLLPNAYVNVLLERPYKNVILTEKNLVQRRPEGNYVYTVDNGILQLHKVELLTEFDNKAVLNNNFATDELLVSDLPDSRLLGKPVDFHIADTEQK